MGFSSVKRQALKALLEGSFLHEVRRGAIDEKNLLATGEVTAEWVARVIARSTGANHQVSPHHQDATLEVHVIVKQGWYVKFYFLEPDTVFISVHRANP